MLFFGQKAEYFVNSPAFRKALLQLNRIFFPQMWSLVCVILTIKLASYGDLLCS